MILNMVGIGVGGGSELNFDVVGNPKPDSPKENTIWLNTNVDITSWEVSPKTPYRISKNKNLIMYPYQNSTQSVDYFECTVYDGGSIRVFGSVPAGVTTEEVEFPILSQGVENGEMLLQPGTYTLSTGDVTSSISSLVMQYSYDNWKTEEPQISVSGTTSVTFTITETAQAVLKIVIASGISNGISLLYKPQLEEGSTATSFIKGDADGQVWLRTSNPQAGMCEFNMFKENTLQVYLMAVKQVKGGVWTKIESYIYQSNAWIPIKFTLTLVPNASTYPSTAWAKNNIVISGTTTISPSVSINENGVLSMNTPKNASYSSTSSLFHLTTKEYFDFSDYSTMTISADIRFTSTYTNTARSSVIMGIIDDSGSNIVVGSRTLTATADAVGEGSIDSSYDISGVSGNYKFRISASQSGARITYITTRIIVHKIEFSM